MITPSAQDELLSNYTPAQEAFAIDSATRDALSDTHRLSEAEQAEIANEPAVATRAELDEAGIKYEVANRDDRFAQSRAMTTTTDLFERAYTGVCRDALISDCTRYRYWLKRWWSDDQSEPWACWIMLNPSTADAAKDDPTIRRCMGFARSWGMAGIYVVNLFALRATNPDELLTAENPIGPENHWAIRQATGLCKGPIVAAWGAHKAVERSGFRKMLSTITDRGLTIHCLGETKAGYPKHPLYIPASKSLEVFAENRMAKAESP